MASRILIVEDDPSIQVLLGEILRREGWSATVCARAEDAVPLLGRGFDLLILDWMLSGAMTGVEFCRVAVAQGRTPVLMLTARVAAEDIVEGLEAGADDYVTKPFDPVVLVARVRALLRRAERQRSATAAAVSALEWGKISVDTQRFEVRREGQLIELTPSEIRILAEILKARGGVLSRKKLLEKIQEPGVTVVERTIDTHVYTLRKKLGADGDAIETVRGVGYRLA